MKVTNFYESYEDGKLLKLITRGNQTAFTVFYRRYWEEMYQSAFYVTRDEEISMDVVQEVFVWLWENRNQWNINHPGSYLRAAVKYKIANVIRSKKLRTTAFERWQEMNSNIQISISGEIEVRELRRVIFDFTGQLPPRCQEIFRLSRFEHLSNREIAHKLNISEKTVENQITIALRRLRRHLGRLAFWLLFFL